MIENNINDRNETNAADREAAILGAATEGAATTLDTSPPLYPFPNRFDIVRGTVFIDTRQDSKDHVCSNIRKARKRMRNNSTNMPARIHIRVLTSPDDQGMVRVIWVEDPCAVDQLISRASLEDLLHTHELVVTLKEPVPVLRLTRLSDVQRKTRGANMRVISPLVDLGPDLFDKAKRSAAVTAAALEHDLDRATVLTILRRYLQGGMNCDAVAGRWVRGVARGDGRQRRVLCIAAVRGKTVKPKFGRPRHDGGPSFLATDIDVEKIVGGATKYYYTPLGGSWRKAWLLTLANSYVDLDPNSSVPLEDQLRAYGPDCYPSLAQFRYWAKSDFLIVARMKKKHGVSHFNLNNRPLHARTEASVAGPGSVFQIDGTRLDVVCVHQLSRRPIGRLTLYLVVDAFSRLIVGFYLYIGNPGYDGAVMALLSCTQNKVELCAESGIKITKAQWPVECLPDTVLGDGELAAISHHELVEKGLINLKIAPAHRPDLKGLVESMFHSVNEKSIHGLPGRSSGERLRCETNPDHAAVLDPRAVRRIVIRWILSMNRRVLTNYQLTEGMVKDGLTPTPVNLWNWGVEKCTGLRRTWDRNELKRMCLPQDKACIGRRGLEFDGLYYKPANESLPEFPTWCVESTIDCSTEVTVTYNPSRVDEVWLHHNDHLVPMVMADESLLARGWSVLEWNAHCDELKMALQAAQESNTLPDAMLEKDTYDEVTSQSKLTEEQCGSLAVRKRTKTDKLADRESEQGREAGRPPTLNSVAPLGTADNTSAPAETAHLDRLKRVFLSEASDAN